jgi:alpha-L-arabinofuranosidase
LVAVEFENRFSIMRIRITLSLFTTFFLSAIQAVMAQANLPIYTDNLVNGFQDGNSSATHDLTNTSPVHSGTHSISVTTTVNTALSFEYPSFETKVYTSLSFWANGGISGGQSLKVYAQYGANVTGPTFVLSTVLATNAWTKFVIPLGLLGVANKSNVNNLAIELTGFGTTGTFYVDDIQLNAASAPAVVHLGVDAGQALHTVDARQFGVNTATWDGNLGNSQTLPLLKEMGCLALRWPGGSTSDTYHWATDGTGNSRFRNVATNLPGAQIFITINYGSGTPSEAVAWVLSANKTNNCGFKYWEIGNECYGTWENDTHAVQHDPYTYATNAATYIQSMRAAYPNVPIKIGVVVVPGEDSYVNNTNHQVTNPRTGLKHYGWTPVMLTTLNGLGVMPDYIIYHFYPQYTTANSPNSADSDPLLLQAAANWSGDAADLRQQISDYIGSPGSNIEMCVTENNSDAGSMGRQSTGLVNALYIADSTSQLMKTEFRSYIWWDLRNGSDTSGDFDPTLYGWRSNGDYGLLSGSNFRYPSFYAEKLLQYFARPADSVLSASSDYLLLSAYAVRRTNGALTMLVINKDTTTNFNAQIALANFVPWASATIQSFGIPQDQAAKNNASLSLQDIATTNFPTAGTNFTYSFPALSLTLFTFAPAASQLAAFVPASGGMVLQLQGQPGTPYVIQTSPDLFSWTPVSTNLLAGNLLNITNNIPPGSSQQFWRAVWLP